jgi:hypothetical protein
MIVVLICKISFIYNSHHLRKMVSIAIKSLNGFGNYLVTIRAVELKRNFIYRFQLQIKKKV